MMLRIGSLALVALAMALGSAASADPWRDNTGAPKEHAAPPPGGGGITYRIVVNKFGRRIRGSAGTSSFRALEGRYIARFPVDVTNCIWVATLARSTTDGGHDEKPGFLSVVRSNGFSDGVFVDTRGMGGRNRNRPFHLVVIC